MKVQSKYCGLTKALTKFGASMYLSIYMYVCTSSEYFHYFYLLLAGFLSRQAVLLISLITPSPQPCDCQDEMATEFCYFVVKIRAWTKFITHCDPKRFIVMSYKVFVFI